MSSHVPQFEARFLAAWPEEHWRETPLVLAVSGGADSVALAAAMAKVKPAGGGNLLAAHFHHGLRGAEADADEQFVRQLCERLRLGLAVGRGDVLQSSQLSGDGIEADARQKRYEFLLETAHAHGARYVATAHTADDQAETILHHILRGTGIGGLGGMPRTRSLSAAVTLIRPLLEFRRTEILQYLSDRHLPYHEDSSNRDISFTRNRIRHELLPQLAAQYNPNITDALLRMGQLAGEAREIIDDLVSQLHQRATRHKSDGVEITCAAMASVPRPLVRELFVRIWREQPWPQQAMGFAEWEALAEMAVGGAAVARDFPGGVHAQRREELLLLTRPRS
jgi:tRNA(Ile)-lysidine synthase